LKNKDDHQPFNQRRDHFDQPVVKWGGGALSDLAQYKANQSFDEQDGQHHK
jgi:hypothetical protein